MQRTGRSSGPCGVALVGLALLVACPVAAQEQQAPPGLENVRVDEHLLRQIPLDLTFRDHTGQPVRLRDLLDGEKPVLLNLVYHTCPSFCSLVLDGTVAVLAQQPWTVGEDFTVLTVSIDPRDTPEVAAERRRRALYRYGRESAENGWHFLVAPHTMTDHELTGAYGVYPEVERLAAAVGFRYQWMPRQRQYAHPGVIMLLTPDGRVARYLYGLEYSPNDVRLGLLEASEGRSVSTVERVFLYCYRYDASQQGYVLVAWRVMQIGGGFCAFLLFAFLAVLWRRETKKKRETTTESSSEHLEHEGSSSLRS